MLLIRLLHWAEINEAVQVIFFQICRFSFTMSGIWIRKTFVSYKYPGEFGLNAGQAAQSNSVNALLLAFALKYSPGLCPAFF
jgi:hypothetical protein